MQARSGRVVVASSFENIALIETEIASDCRLIQRLALLDRSPGVGL